MNENVINLHEAKTHLSRLVDEVVGGTELVIGKAGVPLARLVPYQAAPAQPRQGGQLKGQIWEAPDAWEPDPEVAALFYDAPVFPTAAEPALRVAEGRSET